MTLTKFILGKDAYTNSDGASLFYRGGDKWHFVLPRYDEYEGIVHGSKKEVGEMTQEELLQLI